MNFKKKKNNNIQNSVVDGPLNNFSSVQSIINQGPSKEDPDGMYTGKPMNQFEEPVQDSDDL